MKLDFDDLEVYGLLIGIAQKYGVDPSSSIEAEEFFREVFSLYSDDFDKSKIENFLDGIISKSFICIKDKPKWIQGSEWPYANRHPMTFLGQLDISTGDSDVAKRMFHDDTAYYLFVADNGQTSIVCQQY